MKPSSEVPKRVGVTGATGFIGQHVMRALEANGFKAVALVRDPQKLGNPTVPHQVIDLLDPPKLSPSLVNLDAVVSCAGLTTRRPDQPNEKGEALRSFILREREGTQNLLTAMKSHHIRRLIHLSSCSIYRFGPFTPPMRVDVPTGAPHWWHLPFWTTRPGYAKSKLLTEKLLEEAQDEFDVTILRPGMVYGSGDDRITQNLLRNIGKTIRVLPTTRVPFVHAGDVALAVVASLQNPKSIRKTYNVAGEPEPYVQTARIAHQVFGSATRFVPVPVPLQLAWSNESARRDLKISFRGTHAGFQEVLENS